MSDPEGRKVIARRIRVRHLPLEEQVVAERVFGAGPDSWVTLLPDLRPWRALVPLGGDSPVAWESGCSGQAGPVEVTVRLERVTCSSSETSARAEFLGYYEPLLDTYFTCTQTLLERLMVRAWFDEGIAAGAYRREA